MEEKTISYSNEDLTVLWKPTLCIHSKYCWKELGDVFKPAERPWVNMKAATSERIHAQVNKCPSGALSVQQKNKPDTIEKAPKPLIEVTPNGPLLVHGNIIIKDAAGNQTEKEKITALCRCGHSSNKPYCDGAHSKRGFEA
jgi:uncharacterized Fe-S cluster protein YjdI